MSFEAGYLLLGFRADQDSRDLNVIEIGYFGDIGDYQNIVILLLCFAMAS